MKRIKKWHQGMAAATPLSAQSGVPEFARSEDAWTKLRDDLISRK